jgi:hypothetical protein
VISCVGEWFHPSVTWKYQNIVYKLLSQLIIEGQDLRERVKFFTITERIPFCSREIVVASPVEDYFLYIDDLPPAAKVVSSFISYCFLPLVKY